MLPRTSVLLPRLLLVALAVVATAALSATPAAAHASLQETLPADGQAVDGPPEDVVLRFNEPVTAPTGGLRVFDEEGERVDDGVVDVRSEDELSVGLDPAVADGAYVVTYRVVSADGHPIRGAFVFSVGDARGVDDGLVAQLFDEDGDRPVAAAATVTRAAMYGALLVAAGLLAFVLVITGLSGDERRRLLRASRTWAVVAAVATVIGVSLQTAQVTGLGLASTVDPGLLGETLASDFGRSSMVRLVGLGALVATVVGRPRVAAGAGVVALGSLLLAGHSVTTEPSAVVLTADAAHVGATAVWLGGLVALRSVLSRRAYDDDPVGGATVVAGFSRLAVGTVAVVAASGAAFAWAEVRALRALTTTAYGWTLLVKVALVAVVLVAAAYNHNRLVPSIARVNRAEAPVPAGAAVDDAPPQVDSAAAWGRLRRTVRIEIAVLAAVVLVTAALVYLRPAAEEAGITGALSVYADLGDEAEVNLVVDPNRAGVNEMHVYVLDDLGRPVTTAEELTLELSLPAKDIGPIERDPQVAGPGHWVLTGSELSIAGGWEVGITVRVSAFEQLETTIPVTVNP